MRKIVVTFGLISGAVVSLMMLLTIPFMDRIGFDRAEIIGYTTIVLSSLLVFFGIRAYRETVAGQALTFGRGLTVGLLITMVSCACYVATWQVIYFKLAPDFLEKYTAYVVEQARTSGASLAELQEKARQMQAFKEMYDNRCSTRQLRSSSPFRSAWPSA